MPAKLDRFLKECLAHATTSQCRMSHGAGVIVNGRLRHVACNYYGSNELEPHFTMDTCTTHAEVAAIRKAIQKNDIVVAPSSKGQTSLLCR
jgi:gamma-glutamyl-gamma-aminobutyrate hydrolase PuuD